MAARVATVYRAPSPSCGWGKKAANERSTTLCSKIAPTRPDPSTPNPGRNPTFPENRATSRATSVRQHTQQPTPGSVRSVIKPAIPYPQFHTLHWGVHTQLAVHAGLLDAAEVPISIEGKSRLQLLDELSAVALQRANGVLESWIMGAIIGASHARRPLGYLPRMRLRTACGKPQPEGLLGLALMAAGGMR